MKEIGGYFELETANMPLFHNDGLWLNSGRNAFAYILKTFNIKRIALPFFTCPVVWEITEQENCKIIPYDIDNNFMPTIKFNEEEYILYTNYFGICSNQVKKLSSQYPNIIFDNAQAFFAQFSGIASFYSPRKFFGIPDGGLVISKKYSDIQLQRSTSYNICSHLLKRHDLGAEAAYFDFKNNSFEISKAPLQTISPLTKAMMKNVNYSNIMKTRIENYSVLANALTKYNKINTSLYKDIPLVYPFYLENGAADLRNKLIQHKIFVAKYWPAAKNTSCMSSNAAKLFSENIIPLPIDQRYNTNDMHRILEVICK